MPAAPKRQPKSEVFNIRVPTETKRLIEDAAAITGKTTSEFVLESARGRAADVVLDQTLILLPAADFDAFMAALDNPPPPNAALKALLAKPRLPPRT